MTDQPKLTRTAKTGRTQWTAQFLAASELVRQGYTVSFTMGNHTPDADLMVGTVDGRQFWVDVKGQASRGSWLLGRKADRLNLFYILVLVGLTRERDEFYILNQSDVNHLTAKYAKEHPNQKNIKGLEGCGFRDVADFKNGWETLPPCLLSI